MAASKTILSLLGLVLSVISLAQTKYISATIEKKKVEEILTFLEKEFNVYFSYDPNIFESAPKQSLTLVNTGFSDILKKILPANCDFKIVGEYVAIVPVKRETLKPVVRPERRVPSSGSITDTVIVEKVMVRVDTQWVTKTIEVFDTVVVEKVLTVYETIPQQESGKSRCVFIPELMVCRWHRGDDKTPAYSVIGIGVNARIPFRKMFASAGVTYCQMLQNFRLSNSADHGSEPDSAQEIQSSIERINSIGLISGRIGIGFEKRSPIWSVGAEAGAAIYHTVSADEMQLDVNGDPASFQRSDYKPLIVNVYFRAPITIRINRCSALIVSPFVEYGVNKDLDANASQSRYAFGLSLGLTVH